MSNDKTLQTPYGVFSGVISTGYFPDGGVKEIRLEEKNAILTHAGELIPAYSEDTHRRKFKASVTFHKDGMIKAVALDAQQELITPIGELPAELVTFYETGELKRVFPLDGKISGFWSEEDERELNIPLSFEFDFTSFTAMLIGICFFKSGDIKSITLFPKEIIEINAPEIGAIGVKGGFALYESGKLHSLEPATPVKITTPIGTITAYDNNAKGVNSDSNSLCFDEQGRIISIVTSSDMIAVKRKDGAVRFFAPTEIETDEDAKQMVTLKIDFNYDDKTAVIKDAEGNDNVMSFDEHFNIYNGIISGCSGQDCSSCSQCSH